MSQFKSVEAFQDLVRRLQAESGSAQVVFVATEGAGEAQVGWSPRLNLAYSVGAKGGVGLAPDGRMYETKGTLGSTTFLSQPSADGAKFVETYFPGHALVDLTRRPEWISSCEQTADGGFIISWVGPGAARLTRDELGLPPGAHYPDMTVTLTVSPDGNVLKRHMSAADPHPEETWEYTYRPEMKGLLAAPEVSRGFELKSYRIEATTDTSAFEPSRIEALAVASSMNVAKQLSSPQSSGDSSNAASGASGGGSAPSAPFGDTISIPLLGTGVLLIVVAILAYIKRRGQA